jgi:putative ABC transport system permease protein
MIDVDRLVAASKPGQEEQIRRQIVLPWPQAFRIAIRNVTLRLGRAAITATGVILGIAFLVSVWTQAVVEEATQEDQTLSVAANAQASVLDDDGSLTPTPAESSQHGDEQAARRSWLVVMSLLVCGVGITNSMLMSVTERFREIGTMKCLGALDEFIVRLFLIETAVLGFLGAIVGAIVGHVIMLVVSMIRFGVSVTAKMDWSQMLIYIGFATLIGCVISLVAAVPPAVRASRMPPAAALSTEV